MKVALRTLLLTEGVTPGATKGTPKAAGRESCLHIYSPQNYPQGSRIRSVSHYGRQGEKSFLRGKSISSETQIKSSDQINYQDRLNVKYENARGEGQEQLLLAWHDEVGGA